MNGQPTFKLDPALVPKRGLAKKDHVAHAVSPVRWSASNAITGVGNFPKTGADESLCSDVVTATERRVEMARSSTTGGTRNPPTATWPNDRDVSSQMGTSVAFTGTLRQFGFALTNGNALVWTGTVPEHRVQALLDDLCGGHLPSEEELVEAPLLQGWTPAVAEGQVVLLGAVTGHPRLGTSDLITTSRLIAIDADGRWARTLSRWYRLARPGPDESRAGLD